MFGCGGHAMSVMDTIKNNKEYVVIGFVDKEKTDYTYDGVGVITTDTDISGLEAHGVKYAAMGIGSVKGAGTIRMKVYENAVKEGLLFPVIADATAVVSESAVVEDGTFIGKGALINAETHIGKCAIVNTGAIIEHCVEVGDFTHISVGTVVCGDVIIGNNCMIGANATITQGVKIGDNVTVGAGSVVLHDVLDGETVVGNPARVIRENNG